MQDEKSFEAKMSRIFEASGVKSDSALARLLEVQPQSVGAARKRKRIPGQWIEQLAERYGVSAHWLLFGAGPMRPGKADNKAREAPLVEPPAEAAGSPSYCAQCLALYAKMETANERLYAAMRENGALKEANGVLKGEIAKLEERAAAEGRHLEDMRDGFGPEPCRNVMAQEDPAPYRDMKK